ncbi:J domain-containing protein [Altericista sp. CCNU0014]|uniref:J domain-containing protein n=1 Tax=Altericista sp. CCNU0014 TaxID=3082949 RepID=UPI00384BEFE9
MNTATLIGRAMHEFEAYFRALELDRDATLDEIKQAYKDLVMVWHPDRFGHNARLRHKAEEKLKQFNQAYDCLKQWCADPRQAAGHSRRSSASSRDRAARDREPRSPQSAPHQTQSRQTYSANHNPPPHVKTSGLYITFAHAEYVLEHYCFKPRKDMDASHHEYESGPFVLMVCDDPLALTLSVPCHSLQHFDRILLSIPCKSTGHFCQAEAQKLLKLLHTQASA